MKRKIALLLSLMLLVTALFPVSVLAADDMGLTNAIKSVKTKLDIPESFTLNYYNTYTEGGRKVWNLEWIGEDKGNDSISASVDDKGNIWRYNFYEYKDYNQRKLPKIIWDKAEETAEKFIKRMNPSIASQLSPNHNYVPNLMDPYYSFHFYRKVNGVAFYENYARVEVDRQTGKVTNLYTNWQTDLVFPATAGAIGIDEAQDAYMNKLGLRLEYRYYMKDDKFVAYPVYAPKYSESFIDAFTGEKIELPFGFYRGYDMVGGMGGMYLEGSKATSESAQNIVLSPEEERAVLETSGLIKRAEAEELARNTPELGLTDEFVLERDSLYSNWDDKSSFTWNLYFLKESEGTDREYSYVSVSMDAKTGEIMNFSIGEPREAGAKAKYDQDASRAAVEAFLKDFQPDKFKLTEYDDRYPGNIIPLLVGEEAPQQYSFYYIRKVDGAVFPSNAISVDYDAVNGKVTGYNMTWFDIDFPSLDNVITSEAAHAKLFEEVGLELRYQIDYSYELKLKYGGGVSDRKPEIKLVYSLKTDKPSVLDANTGVLLDYNGKPYKEIKPAEYTDIENSPFKTQIEILAENGISLEGTEFKPNETIKQKDFFQLLTKCLGSYWYDISMAEDEMLEQLYNYLKRNGIVKDGETAYDASVTREDAVKFIIRSLKYDAVADIKGIFICDFKDADSINADLKGYVAIAAGLKIVSGNTSGNFNPKGVLTRGQTAALIYNYLQR